MAKYLTTTLPYVNADPHIGFATELVQADALVRSWRLGGEEVFFNTGTDEHGQKILEAAEKAGTDVKAYADHFSEEFKKLDKALGLSEHAFIRTTNPEHYAAAQEMWRRCDAKGDIYKKSYTGMYCVGCESYKTEKEIQDGHCVIHTNLVLEEITEENYFFKLSNYADKLLAYLSRADSTIPEWRKHEAENFIRDGLEDISISREKKRLSWGVPVPGDDAQVMYVWFDALTNYVSTLGWPNEDGDFKKFWIDGHTVQMAGKDQVRFQSIIFQAMLLSAGIKNTDQIFYHGFINSGGQKMSKSLGNVINPYELVAKYGTDATRYLLLRHVHPTEDSDVTWEKLDEWYTADLVNGLGNLVARVMTLAEAHLSAPIDIPPSSNSFPEPLTLGMEKFEFNQALEYIWGRIGAADARMTAEQPFKLIKTEPDHAKKIIAELVAELYWIGRFLYAFMPETNEKIKQAVKENKKPENLFPRLT